MIYSGKDKSFRNREKIQIIMNIRLCSLELIESATTVIPVALALAVVCFIPDPKHYDGSEYEKYK